MNTYKELDRSKTRERIRPQTYDRYLALHTQHSMYLNGEILSVECESWV